MGAERVRHMEEVSQIESDTGLPELVLPSARTRMRVQRLSEEGILEQEVTSDLGLLRILLTDAGVRSAIIDRDIDKYSKFHVSKKGALDLAVELVSRVDSLAIKNFPTYLTLAIGLSTGDDEIKEIARTEAEFNSKPQDVDGNEDKARIARVMVLKYTKRLKLRLEDAKFQLQETLDSAGVSGDEFEKRVLPYRETSTLTSLVKLELLYELEEEIENERQKAFSENTGDEIVDEGEPMSFGQAQHETRIGKAVDVRLGRTMKESERQVGFMEGVEEDLKLLAVLQRNTDTSRYDVEGLLLDGDRGRIRLLSKAEQEEYAQRLFATVNVLATDNIGRFLLILEKFPGKAPISIALSQRFMNLPEGDFERAEVARETINEALKPLKSEHGRLFTELGILLEDSGIGEDEKETIIKTFSTVSDNVSTWLEQTEAIRKKVEDLRIKAFPAYARLWDSINEMDNLYADVQIMKFVQASPEDRAKMARNITKRLDRYFRKQYRQVRGSVNDHLNRSKETEFEFNTAASIEGLFQGGSRFKRRRFLEFSEQKSAELTEERNATTGSS